ncbi:MAG: TRAP transporter substrate-binding protein, partial [Clostridia bacterium]|nr:TRAP transporter substrate-binding protein [Clostridia bacterium]
PAPAPRPAPEPAPAPAPAPRPAPAPAPAPRPVTLNFAHFMSAVHPVHVNILVPFARELEQATNGRVKITFHVANSLVGANELYDSAVTGVADIVFTLPGYTPGQFPLTSVADLPGIFNTPIQASKALLELYDTTPALQNEYRNTKVLMFGTTDIGQIKTTRPITRLEDLRGLRLRSPGAVQNSVITALGAIPVTLPASDVYDAIERRMVDGTLMPPSTIISFNLHEVVTHITMANLYASPLVAAMNLNTFNKLSPGDQKIILELGRKYSPMLGVLYQSNQTNGLNAARNRQIEIIELSPAERSKFDQALRPLVGRWIDERRRAGLPGQEVYDRMIQLAAKHR